MLRFQADVVVDRYPLGPALTATKCFRTVRQDAALSQFRHQSFACGYHLGTEMFDTALVLLSTAGSCFWIFEFLYVGVLRLIWQPAASD